MVIIIMYQRTFTLIVTIESTFDRYGIPKIVVVYFFKLLSISNRI